MGSGGTRTGPRVSPQPTDGVAFVLVSPSPLAPMDLFTHPTRYVRRSGRSIVVLLAILALTPGLGTLLSASTNRGMASVWSLGPTSVQAQTPVSARPGADARARTEASTSSEAPPTVIFLVRHAERAEDGTSDPPISEVGQDRARLLARMLRDVDLTHVHTTDFRRTRATGDPTAEAAGVEMALYDPDDLEGFADRLRATPGRHLVLGHSNTTPQLVEALGGDPHGDIDELEYDRLYVMTLTPDGPSTVLIRFGTDLGR